MMHPVNPRNLMHVVLLYGTSALVAIALAFGISRGIQATYHMSAKIGSLEQEVAGLTQQVANLRTATAAQNAHINEVANGYDTLASNYDTLSKRPRTVVEQKIVKQPSENEEITHTVAAITPAVVSIVATKEVPKYDVVYVNPFGNDPAFGNIGIQVPMYQQHGTTSAKVAAATGFIITPTGYVLTNAHVVADTNAQYTALLSDGRQLPATVVWRDTGGDVALLELAGSNFPVAPLGDSNALKLGERVIAVGNALGEYNNTVSQGIISGLHRDLTAGDAAGTSETLKDVIQTDAAINPGNSGGPLMSLSGTVVGINVAKVVGSDNIAFAIPIQTVKDLVQRAIGTSL